MMQKWKLGQNEEGTNTKNEVKLKLTLTCEIQMTVEGNVNDRNEIIKITRAT